MSIYDKVAELLQRKQQLDRLHAQTNNLSGYDEFVTEALELLLRLALERAASSPRPKR